MLTPLLTAVENQFLAANPLNTALGGRLYNTHAPQFGPFPYGIFFLVASTASRSFGYKRDRPIIQFSIFDQPLNASPMNLYDLESKLVALFDDCVLTVAGYQFVAMTRVSTRVLCEEEMEPKVFAAHIDYEIQLTT